MIKKDGNTMIVDTFQDLKISSSEFNKAKNGTVKLIVKSAEHDQKVIDIVNALKEMKDLEWVEIQNPDAKLCSIDGMLYSRDGKNLYFCARDGIVEIPDGTKTICECAASNCLASEIIIPDSVKHIKDFAFFGNYMLEEVKGGSSLTDIGDSAFLNCIKLKKFHIGKDMKYIGSGAFADTGLTKIDLPEGLEYVGNSAFQTICISANENGIYYAAELRPEDMYEIHIPKSLKSIRGGAFASASRVYTDSFDKQLILACKDNSRTETKYRTKFCLIKIGDNPEIILPKTIYENVDWIIDKVCRFLHSKEDIPPALIYHDIDNSIINNDSVLSAAMEYCRRYHDANVEQFMAGNVKEILQIGVHDLETLIEYINAGTFNDETLKQMFDMADELFGPDAVTLKGYILNKQNEKSETSDYTL